MSTARSYDEDMTHRATGGTDAYTLQESNAIEALNAVAERVLPLLARAHGEGLHAAQLAIGAFMEASEDCPGYEPVNATLESIEDVLETLGLMTSRARRDSQEYRQALDAVLERGARMPILPDVAKVLL